MKKFILLVGLLCASFALKSQSITKTTSSVVWGTVCPVSATWYEVSVPSGLTSCEIVWSATNGQATRDVNNQRKAKVEWNDTPGASGTVTATFVGCSNEDSNGTTASKTELILSVKNQSWGSFGNSVNVDYCTKGKCLLPCPACSCKAQVALASQHKLKLLMVEHCQVAGKISQLKTGQYILRILYKGEGILQRITIDR